VIAYDGPEPVEDGVTFAENALIKARAAAALHRPSALADDSGICVDVLGGAPGVFSAYWAGHAKDAAANLHLLLDQLSDIRDPHRTAQFVSTIALVVPGAGSSEQVVEGRWRARRHGALRRGRVRVRPPSSSRTVSRSTRSGAWGSGRRSRRTPTRIAPVRSRPRAARALSQLAGHRMHCSSPPAQQA
jgi:XTP/dITP diphosphohydrolase